LKSETRQKVEFEMDMSEKYSELEPAEAEVELNMRHIGEIVLQIIMDLELQKE